MVAINAITNANSIPSADLMTSAPTMYPEDPGSGVGVCQQLLFPSNADAYAMMNIECVLVVDNAKSHSNRSTMRCHQYRPEAYYRRRKPFLPHARRRRCRSSSNHMHTRTGRETYLSSSVSLNESTMSPSLSSLTPSSCWTDDISLTRVAMLNRRTLRRSVSSDGSFDGEEVYDRWMSSSHATGTTGVSTTRAVRTSLSSAAGGSVSNLDSSDDSEDEPPSYAFINAHQPKRQVSDDPEEIQRLVESLRRQGSL